MVQLKGFIGTFLRRTGSPCGSTDEIYMSEESSFAWIFVNTSNTDGSDHLRMARRIADVCQQLFAPFPSIYPMSLAKVIKVEFCVVSALASTKRRWHVRFDWQGLANIIQAGVLPGQIVEVSYTENADNTAAVMTAVAAAHRIRPNNDSILQVEMLGNILQSQVHPTKLQENSKMQNRLRSGSQSETFGVTAKEATVRIYLVDVSSNSDSNYSIHIVSRERRAHHAP